MIHISPGFWTVLSFVWSTVHDFVYLGIYAIFTRMHIIKKSKSSEERLDALEKHLGLSS